MRKRERSLPAGMLVGAVSGLVASVLMLEVIETVGPKLLDAMREPEDAARERAVGEGRGAAVGRPGDSVTMKVADAAGTAVGRHMTVQGRKKGGAVLHYGFRALAGAVYGGIAEYVPAETMGFGSVFGVVLWAGTDLLSIPALGLAKWPTEETAGAHVTHCLAHVVYGMGMEGVRRVLRLEFD